jgi:inhibitor of nuclear factor kappa-B kinase subunit alpha
MVTVAVSVLGSMSIHFLEPGVKINGQYYRDTVLKTMLLPEIRGISGDCFVFQQDRAPAHRARDTVELLKTETPDFIQLDLWPPNSPDLNPVDYSVWGILQERVYHTRVTSLEELKQRLRTEWATLDHNIIAAAIRQWRRRLTACVKTGGGHFEQCLSLDWGDTLVTLVTTFSSLIYWYTSTAMCSMFQYYQICNIVICCCLLTKIGARKQTPQSVT